jgi:hypothetical protein
MVNKWEDTFLQAMSLQTDPLAENIISDITKGNNFGALRGIFTTLSKNHDEIINNSILPKSAIDYFNTELSLPSWADPAKIATAQLVYAKYGPQIALILNFKALPLCYACKNGAKVLASTGRLSPGDVSKTMRRLFETSQMVMNVMSPGGLLPKGEGIVTIKKVRLYHAAIRFFLKNPPPKEPAWDTAHYGEPINQEEMAGTLMAFSALVLNGLEQLGAEISKDEKDAYMHCWNIVGHFIGLDPKLYPADFNEGWDLGIAIINRNHEACVESKLLTKSLLDFSENFFTRSFIDKILFGNLPSYLLRFFVENVEIKINANILAEVGADTNLSYLTRLRGKVFIFFIKAGTDAEDHNFLVRKIVSTYGLKFLKGLVQQYLHTYQTPFYIPGSLKESWKM